MDDLYRCLIEQNGLAFATGVLLFLLTLLLVARRIIGFTLSVIFMLLALVAPLVLSQSPSALPVVEQR